MIDIRDYRGQVFVGYQQFNGRFSNPISLTGKSPVDLFLLANCFYHARPQVTKDPSANLYLLGNIGVGKIETSLDEVAPHSLVDSVPPDKLADIARAMDDLRRLGKLDLRQNHPSVYPPNSTQRLR